MKLLAINFNVRFLVHIFHRQIYYAGVSKKSGMSELIAIINATDKDLGANSTIELLITASYLFKFGATRSTGSLANSPFGSYPLSSPLFRFYNPRRHCFVAVAKPLCKLLAVLHVNFLCYLSFSVHSNIARWSTDYKCLHGRVQSRQIRA